MKRKTAKEILADSFRELAKTKRVDRITVRDIVDNCGYSSATFYRHFRDKYDLIVWDYGREIARVMARIDERTYTWNQALLDVTKSFYLKREYLANLFLHTSGHDSFIRNMGEIHYSAFRKHLQAVGDDERLDANVDLCARMYCLGSVSLACEWILGRFQATPEELAKIFEISLPSPLRRYVKTNERKR